MCRSAIPADRLCAAAVLPLARHPRIDSRVIVFDLGSDPERAAGAGCRTVADRLYTPAADLAGRRIPHCAEGSAPQPLPCADRLVASARSGLRSALASIAPPSSNNAPHACATPGPRWRKKYGGSYADERERSRRRTSMPALYDGFIGDGDKRRCGEVRATPPQALGDAARSDFATRACRHCCSATARATGPTRWTHDERQRWDDYRRQRLCVESGLSEYSFDGFRAELQRNCARCTPAMARSWRCSTSSRRGATSIETSLLSMTTLLQRQDFQFPAQPGAQQRARMVPRRTRPTTRRTCADRS